MSSAIEALLAFTALIGAVGHAPGASIMTALTGGRPDDALEALDAHVPLPHIATAISRIHEDGGVTTALEQLHAWRQRLNRQSLALLEASPIVQLPSGAAGDAEPRLRSGWRRWSADY